MLQGSLTLPSLWGPSRGAVSILWVNRERKRTRKLIHTLVTSRKSPSSTVVAGYPSSRNFGLSLYLGYQDSAFVHPCNRGGSWPGLLVIKVISSTIPSGPSRTVAKPFLLG